MNAIARLHEQFYTKEPALYLVTACVVCYLLTIVSPDSWGAVDYMILSGISFGLYSACVNVSHLKAAKAIFYIQIPTIAVTLMAMVDGFARSFGNWFEDFALLTGALSLLELIALLFWTPWADVIKGLYRTVHNVRRNTINSYLARHSNQNSFNKD